MSIGCADRAIEPAVSGDPQPSITSTPITAPRSPDPYRWLEDDTPPERQVGRGAEQGDLRLPRGLPVTRAILQRLKDLYNYAKSLAPSRKGDYFFFKNDGLQNQNVLYVQDGLDGEPEVLLDPNTWSKDGTVAPHGVRASDDAQVRSPTASSRSGSRLEHVERARRGDAAQAADRRAGVGEVSGRRGRGQGVLLQPLPRAEEGRRSRSGTRTPELYYHRLGTPQSEDKLVYQHTENPKWTSAAPRPRTGISSSSPSATAPQQVTRSSSWTSDRARRAWRRSSRQSREQVQRSSATTAACSLQTDYNAPKYQIIAIDPRKPGEGELEDDHRREAEEARQRRSAGRRTCSRAT